MKLLYMVLMVIQMAQCAKILGIFPLAVKSHYILGKSLMRGLAEKGHHVTVINPFGEKAPPKNGTYRDILLTTSSDMNSGGPPIDYFKVGEMNFITFMLYINNFGNLLTEKTLSHPNVQKLLNSKETFDVVILEQFMNDGLKVFVHHYQAPLVLFSTFASNAWINPLVANPAPPSYIPEQNAKFNHENFFDRLRNFVKYVFGELNRHLIFFPAQNKIAKKYFPNAPDLDVLNYNVSLVLLNSHLSTNMAVPRVPSMIDIGGFHVQPPKKLTSELREYLDSAKDGVIFFSMGSALQSVNFPPEKREAILRVFSKLKENVLWKWENDVLPGQPPNVKLGKWLPQTDILAHPNLKAFITHGGLLSLIEGVYHGVPLLTIPVFGDQMWNAAQAASNNIGRYILYNELNEERLAEALNDVLNNPKYRNNMKRRSQIMHDRRHKPIDDVDYWIRYVIRHQGAPHLRVAGLQLAWYQYSSLDVAIFISAISLLIFLAIYLLLKFVKTLTVNRSDNKIKRS